jgi:hypothetical protein
MEGAMLKQITLLKRITLGAALVTFAVAGSLRAQTLDQDRIPMPPVIEWPPDQATEMPGIRYEVFGTTERRADTARPTPALLTMIVTWLSMNFGLPATHDLPKVELVGQMKMAALGHHGLVSDHQTRTTVEVSHTMPLNAGRDLLAIYDVRRQTIYLREEWTGATPAELSVLIHEMVHHLQNVAGLKYECPEAREKLAFAAQEQWLALFGRNLEDDLELDAFTVLVRSTCPY